MVLFQPKSLLLLAAKETANEAWRGTQHALHYPNQKQKLYDVRWTAQFLPADIQLVLFPFYEKNQLGEFISGHQSIDKFKKFSPNDDMFQKFLFHFFRQIESDPLPTSDFLIMKHHYDTFKSDFRKQLSYIGKENNKRVMENVTSFDWSTRSLGFDHPVLGQELPSVSKQETFFKIKFEKIHSFKRSPPPDLPASVESVIPSQPNYSFQNDFFSPKIVVGAQPTPYSEPFQESAEISNQFFDRLSAMALASKNDAHQEVLVFAAQLLERSDFQSNLFIRDFYIHVWGMLAVCLSKLNVKQLYIQSCIHQMKLLVRVESHLYDSALYQQKVCAALDWFSKEKLFFEFMIEKVPKSSIFYRQSLHLHLESMMKHFEDVIMEIYILKMRKETILFSRKLKYVNSVMADLEKTLHSVFSQTNIDKKTYKHAFSFFSLIDLHQVLLNQIVGGANAFSKSKVNQMLKMCGCVIDNSEHYVELFLIHYNRNTNIHFLDLEMESSHDFLKANSHCENPIGYADLLFTNVLLLKVLDELHNPAHVSAREAKDLYEKINHPRFYLLKDYIECETPNLNRSYESRKFNISYYSKFTFVDLIKSEPLLQHLIRCGVQSIHQFDVDS